MSRVFISYRRDDSRWVARALKNSLAHELGHEHVFMDIDSIDPGADFVEVLDETISKVDVLIAIIGPEFLTITDEHGKRRLDDPRDFVRLEIVTALQRGKRVIPLLEAGTEFPTEDQLPDDLKPLVRRNAVEISGNSFERDVEYIVSTLKRLWESEQPVETRGVIRLADVMPTFAQGVRRVGQMRSQSNPQAATAAGQAEKPGGRKWVMAVSALLLAAVVLYVVLSMLRSNDPRPVAANTNPAATSLVDLGTELETAEPIAAMVSPTTDVMDDASSQQRKETMAAVESTESTLAESPLEKSPGSSLGEPTRETSPESPPGTSLQSPPETMPDVAGMTPIQPGTFSMGSPPEEAGRNDDETLHQVTISEPYYLSTYEVTQAQYVAVMGDLPSQAARGDNIPVANVSWDDARRFCKKLNELSTLPKDFGIGDLPPGYRFSLPTEAQWEYACRAGRTERLSAKELFETAICYKPRTDGWNAPQPVGSRKSNAWGLFDMLGNVEEWCLDIYTPYPTEPVSDPVGTGNSKDHVIRGGSYFSSNLGPTHNCRTALRDKHSGRSQVRGFRLAGIRETKQ